MHGGLEQAPASSRRVSSCGVVRIVILPTPKDKTDDEVIKMTNYIIRRLLLVPVLLFGVTVMIFGMLQFLGPVERSALYVRDFPKNEKAIEGIIKKYGLDKPLYEQYWRWLVGIVDPASGVRGRWHPLR